MTTLNSPNQRQIIVAEGDSWFHYPNRSSEISVSKPGDSNFIGILYELRKTFEYEIRSAAKYGDTLEQMANNDKQKKEFEDVLISIKEDNRLPTAVLLSAGGNDLIKKMPRDNIRVIQTLLEPAGSKSNSKKKPKLNQDRVDKNLAELEVNYNKLIERVINSCKKHFKRNRIPIFFHGYARPVPDGSSFDVVWCPLSGPWLKPAFSNLGYHDLKQNTKIMGELIDQINGMLKKLSKDMSKEFDDLVHYVDIRKCATNSLKKDVEAFPGQKIEKYRLDWDNELHPRQEIFRSMAYDFDWEIKKFHLKMK